MKKFPVIFCDMDEVLSDFIGGACKVHGITRKQLEETRIKGNWDICEPLKISEEEFWKPIDQLGESFWTSLEPLPWCVSFYQQLKEYAEHLIVLSSPSSHPGCLSGKATWLRKVLGANVDFCPFKHKHYLSNEGRVLIDDRHDNLIAWMRANQLSIPILFPSPGNKAYQEADDPVPFVLEILTELSKYN